MLKAGLTEAVRAGQQGREAQKQQIELAQHAQHSSRAKACSKAWTAGRVFDKKSILWMSWLVEKVDYCFQQLATVMAAAHYVEMLDALV